MIVFVTRLGDTVRTRFDDDGVEHITLAVEPHKLPELTLAPEPDTLEAYAKYRRK